MSEPVPFRIQVKDLLETALGEPEVTTAPPGEVYRWSLRRVYGLTFYVTLDSPEHPDVAHVMLSDGPRFQTKPVESYLLKNLDEASALVSRIVSQWQRSGRD